MEHGDCVDTEMTEKVELGLREGVREEKEGRIEIKEEKEEELSLLGKAKSRPGESIIPSSYHLILAYLVGGL